MATNTESRASSGRILSGSFAPKLRGDRTDTAQNVLCIDASSDPALFCVVALSDDSCTVLERHWRPFSEVFPPPPAEAAPDAPAVPEQPEVESGISTLIRTPYTETVLIVSPPEYHSLTLELPIQDARSLARVIDLEVQDLVPFELDEFVIEHKVLAPTGKPERDVHVSLAPRPFLTAAIRSCERAGIHPLVVTTPAGALSILYQLPGLGLPDNSAVLQIAGGRCYLVCQIAGDTRVDRVWALPRADLAGADAPEEQNLEALLAAPTYARELFSSLQRTLMSIERKYSVVLAPLFFIGSEASLTQLKEGLKRDVRPLETRPLFTLDTPVDLRSALAAFAVHDRTPRPPLTNFRVREFSYRPRLKELFEGLAQIRSLFLFAAVALVGTLLILYWIREHRLSALRAAMLSQITAVIPDFNAPEGEEVTAVDGLVKSLNNQLSDLGSPVSSSPLQTFLVLSEDVATQPDIKVRRVSIRGTRVRIDGTTPDYTALETLVGTLRERREVYCRVKQEASGSGQTRTFTVEITLCE